MSLVTEQQQQGSTQQETRKSRLGNSEPISSRKAVTKENEGLHLGVLAYFRTQTWLLRTGLHSPKNVALLLHSHIIIANHLHTLLTDHAPPLLPPPPRCPPRRTPRRSHTRARPCAAPATAAAFKQWHLHPSRISLPPITCRLLVHSSLPRPPVPTPPWPRAV